MSGEAASRADRVVDELLPEELDWVDLVRSYPKTALVVAAVGGYILGSKRGSEVVVALGAFAADKVTDGVNDYLGDKVL